MTFTKGQKFKPVSFRKVTSLGSKLWTLVQTCDLSVQTYDLSVQTYDLSVQTCDLRPILWPFEITLSLSIQLSLSLSTIPFVSYLHYKYYPNSDLKLVSYDTLKKHGKILHGKITPHLMIITLLHFIFMYFWKNLKCAIVVIITIIIVSC